MTEIGELLTAKEAAAILGFKPQTLTAWRCREVNGLPFIKAGRAVRYMRRDIESWITSRRVLGASQAADCSVEEKVSE